MTPAPIISVGLLLRICEPFLGQSSVEGTFCLNEATERIVIFCLHFVSNLLTYLLTYLLSTSLAYTVRATIFYSMFVFVHCLPIGQFLRY